MVSSSAELLQLGMRHQQAGDFAQAELVYRRILELDPQDADAWHLLGLVEYQRGRLEAAVAAIERAIELSPQQNSTYYSNLGEAQRMAGRLDEAAAACRRALQLSPSSPGAHNSLGLALLSQGNTAQAITHFELALQASPESVATWNNLGEAFRVAGSLDRAEACFRRTLELDPQLAAAHLNLGNVLHAARRIAEAAACFRTALEFRPTYAKAHSNLSLLYLEEQQLPEAWEHAQAALRCDPTLAEALVNLSALEHQRGNLSAAVRYAREALGYKPNLGPAHNMLGTALQDQGLAEEAMRCFQSALVQSAPNQRPRAHSNLLFCWQHLPQVNPEQLLEAHCQWDREYALPLGRHDWPIASDGRSAKRPLRVGLVSSDLGCHPVGQFVRSWLEYLPRSRAEVFCYSDRPVEDRVSNLLRTTAAEWRNVRTLGDAALAAQIRDDRIDILFDLAGHTRDNRLLVFARRPAPVQATWMGYVGTTGLSAIDFLLADRFLIPPGEEAQYREAIVRLPDGWLCYHPADDAPDVAPPPCLTQGQITFGCFNNCAKIVPPVVAAWAQILHRVPASRLLMKFKWFDDAAVRERYTALFSEHGIRPDQFEFLGWSPQVDHLAAYARVDLALDTFPYTGGITTCEALWMGVPVVTCVGPTFAGRQSFSHLSNVGLGVLCADDPADYVERAVNWASDWDRLQELRSTLRERMRASPLCDGRRFAGQIATALESMWQRRHETAQGSGADPL